ncbi:ribosomal protein L11 methyltransferase [Geotalea uraniireducens]|uniref:Ribosomal protein L11 methyltransferase n=1 Tax=Geotalea uraniireducens TaxID=351604 RepID=A0ABM8EFU1_9BACT|nr:50S ribosomal protein L11 methyltransferase [Geotalea uraniireducens]BDV41260.1 ribosomal protein L11 methyltransferase [Geotalea uraniireducens]
MDKTWAEVTCETPAPLVDLLADFLVELSGNGVSIDNQNLDTFSLDGIAESPTTTVRAYFAVDDQLDENVAAVQRFLNDHRHLAGEFELPPPMVAIIKEEDWATGWRQHFSPSRIGRHFVIKPTWEPFSPLADDLVIELDPGMAFGTGTHPTTKLCLEALESIFLSQRTAGETPAVLDVGTGSGILAIAAAKLGAAPVIGTDIDPDAIAVARENCTLNDVTVALSTTPLQEIAEHFTVVLANILAEDLVRMATELAAKVAPGGFLVLSGILLERERFVMDGFSTTGLSLRATTREGEWSCLIYQAE